VCSSPVSMGTDVFADRWTPLIVRELVLGNTRFNDIVRGLPGISRSLLVQRLKHLERKGVITTWPSRTGRGNEYQLTPAGKDLDEVVMALGRWAGVCTRSDSTADELAIAHGMLSGTDEHRGRSALRLR
jgi:DNA-binding HxlR family transcriptional regulator